ncbi:polygalacturonase pgaI [Aspergillus heteromorphus CBS 117.55]|uniref:endo-polygalacturonase n=1 Tax=Aspergillus heteromorphus CBS 117.55 TaxID=1448321 RepID=A0A317V0M0_9EURO|nr:polygalacturonase pgaI [Aspergillus heteromorphus CBS 117.55]PWY67874.1 polygalacturonase pgaI [Aspergillus heteromorphus CBS 117.55]
MHSFQLLGLAAFGSLVAAAPTSELVKKSSCTFTSASAAKEGISKCSDIILKDIEVPAGETLDLAKAADGASGTTTFGYEEWDGPLIRLGGKGLTITQVDGALINGGGERWWDGKGTNGGKKKPKFMYVHDIEDSTIKGLQIKNTPVQAISVMATNVHLTDLTINNKEGDSKGGHNTDGFDISESNGVYITGATVYNQDDCLAINSGENIHFTGGYCSGGHGLSIGSVGGRSDNTVSNIHIEDSQIVDSANGVRIKTVYKKTGDVDNITYSNIKLSGISSYGVVIEQDYENSSPTGYPSNTIPIKDVTLDRITGSVDDDATRIYIICGDGSCSDWTWKDVEISGGKKSDKCEHVPSGASC